jgi:DNA (cytosine-5)-methyltransferase 1
VTPDLTAVSLFAGVGGIDLAMESAGVRVVAAVEIDPACRGVLARHFPDTKLFEDVTEVTGDQLIAAGFVPGRGVLAAGWPCQGNSVAGRRGGMGDPRSGLWRHVVRLLAETSPRWFLGENVPGLLSVSGGAGIAVVRGDLAQLGYWWAERILDAQHFGIPQRRRRVYFVGCLGNRTAPVEVLLEPEGGEGNPAARGAAGADIAGTPGSRAGGGRTTDLDGRGAYIAAPLTTRPYADEAAAESRLIAATIQGGGRRGHRIDAEGAAGGHLVPFDTAQITAAENRANPQPGDPAPTLNGSGQVHVAETAYALTSRASRASREETYIAHPITSREAKRSADSDATNGLIITAAECVTGPVTHALTSEGADASEDGTGRGTFPVALRGRDGGSAIETGGDGDPAFTVRTPGGGSSYPQAPALGTTQVAGVQTAMAVRRLTPLECSRLQGFPDGWVRYLADGTEQSDSAQYRQLGNSVAVPVVAWISRRLVAADARLSRQEPAA